MHTVDGCMGGRAHGGHVRWVLGGGCMGDGCMGDVCMGGECMVDGWVGR